MGIAKLIFMGMGMGMGRNENFTFSHSQSEEEKQPVGGGTSASPGTSADSDTLDCHSPPAKKHRVFDVKDLCDQKTINSKAASWQNISSCQPEWEWERDGMGITSGNGKEMGIKLS